MTGFDKRVELHDKIQNHLLYLFDISGYPCEPYGIESGKGLKIHKDLLKCVNDTAKYVRHQPDKVIIKNDEAILIDIKTQQRYDTDNYSVELDSYKVCKSLEEIGCKILYIFNKEANPPYELCACYVKEIEFCYIDENPNWSVKGSRTPFGLIPKNANYIKPIESFFELKLPITKNPDKITSYFGGN